jgi:4-hydroxybenzoate polyprenyltransferase
MDRLKTLLVLIAVILAALVAMTAIGFVYGALQFLLLVGLICLAVGIALRFLMKPAPRQIDESDPQRELRKAERTLEEYKRKQLK